MSACRKKRIGVFPKIFITFCIACFLLIVVQIGTRELMEWLYPLKYSAFVTKASLEFDVPEEIIYSVIRTESSFKPKAVSVAGAVGLMQLMPETFEWLLEVMGEELPSDAIYYPEVNIRCGVYYLAYLKRELGEWETVFAAYNAGICRVKRWLADERITEQGRLVAIPIGETAQYVIKIAKAREMYQKLYDFK